MPSIACAQATVSGTRSCLDDCEARHLADDGRTFRMGLVVAVIVSGPDIDEADGHAGPPPERRGPGRVAVAAAGRGSEQDRPTGRRDDGHDG